MENIQGNTVLSKLLRKKTIWTEIKAREQEYKLLQKQINQLEAAKANISFKVGVLLTESQALSEYLDGLEYKSLNIK